ncbi:hypothetical protein BY458DRAFT_493276 [Sporodiniella umbellata]|nr:hypothetical protein BY458DRAFT_493276 [Sporodiniella umbellata]
MMSIIPLSPPITPKTLHEQYDDEIDFILLNRRLSKTHCRTKSIPRRSLSSHTRGSFQMNTFSILIKKEKIRRPSVSSKKAKPDKSKTESAIFYDTMDLALPDEQYILPQWMPNMNAFEQRSHVRAIWKGTPLDVSNMPYYGQLHHGEVNIASVLRLSPEQYLKCRRSLILAAQQFDKSQMKFRKSDAQKCVRIDVNKTSSLWCVFNALGWFKPKKF